MQQVHAGGVPKYVAPLYTDRTPSDAIDLRSTSNGPEYIGGFFAEFAEAADSEAVCVLTRRVAAKSNGCDEISPEGIQVYDEE